MLEKKNRKNYCIRKFQCQNKKGERKRIQSKEKRGRKKEKSEQIEKQTRKNERKKDEENDWMIYNLLIFDCV